jgi:glycine cleavage system H protein
MEKEFLELTYDKFTLRVDTDCLYHPEDTWAKLEGELVVVGVTDLFQTNAGDVAFVNLPKKGAQFAQNAEVGNMETIKTTAAIVSPVSGMVEEVNQELETRPELINTDVYGQGWIMKIRSDNWAAESAKLLSPEAYFKVMAEKLKNKLG